MSELVSYKYHLPPLVAIACYLAYPKQVRIDSSVLHILSTVHNGLLVAFSGWTFVSLSQILYEDGIVFQSHFYFNNPRFDNIIFWFYISKYYELIDTFILYLSGKSPIFLQKYHHIGAIVCWHLHYVYKVDCVWIPSIANSFVHIIMYSYYLGCLLRVKQVRFIKPYITTLQLTQLVVPNFFCLYYYQPPIETVFKYNLIKMFVGYVSGLVVLFSQFFYRNYVHKD